MSIKERRESLGSFSIRLKDTTGPQTTRALKLTRGANDSKGFALVCVTPNRVNLHNLGLLDWLGGDGIHPLLTHARWTGVLRETGDLGRTLEGDGLESMLCDPDDIGQWTYELTDKVIQAQPATIVNRTINGGSFFALDASTVNFPESHLRLGSLETTGGAAEVHRFSDLWDYRRLLRWASHLAGMRYRIDPQGRYHWGHPEDVYGATPRMLIGRGLPAWDDPDWPTVRPTFDDWGETTRGWMYGTITDVPADHPSWSVAGARYPTSGASAYVSPLKMLPVEHRMNLPVDRGENGTMWTGRSSWIVADAQLDRWSATVTGELEGSPNFHPVPGEPVWLWDAELGIEDPANTIHFGGRDIRPRSVPLLGVEWEPVEGNGVYLVYVDRSGTPGRMVLDLTDDVALAETRTVTLELGRGAEIL